VPFLGNDLSAVLREFTISSYVSPRPTVGAILQCHAKGSAASAPQLREQQAAGDLNRATPLSRRLGFLIEGSALRELLS
jgi:hypothetical protein